MASVHLQPSQEGDTDTKIMSYNYVIHFIVRTTCVILSWLIKILAIFSPFLRKRHYYFPYSIGKG